MTRSTLYRIVQGVVLALIVILLLHIFVFDSYIVRGDSMAPGIVEGDVVVINKLAYQSRQPKRGDIVVGRFRALESIVVKRVIAVPPEWITITPSTVYVQEGRGGTTTPVSDTQYIELPGGSTNGATTTYRLDPYEYYLMGDNRAVSEDSRAFGPMDGYNIKGRVMARFRLSDASLHFL
jgi:signal peptidase I